MAQFEGTIREFTKYIGAYCRLKVSCLSAKHKKETGKCEECGATNSLESAHVKGHERPLIISNILSQFIEEGKISIDLDEFEERFVAAHFPIVNTIKILCATCHRRYDGKSAALKYDPIPVLQDNFLPVEETEAKGDETIEKLISESLTKAKAIAHVNSSAEGQLKAADTLFSNINSAIDVWWLEPNNEKFKTGFNFILHYPDTRTLFHFYIPAQKIRDPKGIFYQRGDSNYSKIFIAKSPEKFVDRKGFDFGSFLVNEVRY